MNYIKQWINECPACKYKQKFTGISSRCDQCLIFPFRQCIWCRKTHDKFTKIIRPCHVCIDNKQILVKDKRHSNNTKAN